MNQNVSNGPKAVMISNILIFCIYGLRPILGQACCKYPVSCGVFAVEQLKSESLHKALWNIIKRLISCNPFNNNIS